MQNKKLIEAINNPFLFNFDLIDIQNLSSKFNLSKKKEFKFKKKINISISSDYTTNYLVDLLPIFFANHNIDINITETSFGSLKFLTQDLKNKFWNDDNEILLLIPSSQDLKFMPNFDDSLKKIKTNAQKEADFWINIWKKIKKNIVQTTFDPVNLNNLGYLDGVKYGGYIHYIRTVNSILIESQPSNVDLIDIDTLLIKNNNTKWYDSKIYNLTKQPWSMDTLPFLAKQICATISGIIGLSKKVLITDLDNTLWGGIVGDDGLDGIVLGEETPEGQAYLNLQKYLKKLAEKGIIICVCSKNDQKISKEVFLKHKHMKLKLDDISVFVSNFNDKATNIKKISETLNLGLDSFVFIDDNKIECELVKKKIPEITVVNMDTDPSNFVERIESLLPFYFKNITKEDIKRISSYKKIELINSARKESKNLDDFLKNLKPRLTFEKINKSNCERSSQLIAKTNQFKFNANLFSPNNLLLKKDKCLPISFEDKYQNYGVIGVLVYNVNKKDKSLIIENWVLSCRVFSRRIENFILDFLKKKAQELKCSKISFQFDITKKNLYLQNFLKEIGLKINKNKKQYFLNLVDLKNNKKSYIISK